MSRKVFVTDLAFNGRRCNLVLVLVRVYAYMSHFTLVSLVLVGVCANWDYMGGGMDMNTEVDSGIPGTVRTVLTNPDFLSPFSCDELSRLEDTVYRNSMVWCKSL